MGFRYSRRVKLGGGLGLNLSKSGVSTSYRTKFGSFGSRGFSIRTGIPGLYYRGGRGKGGEAALIALLFVLAYYALVFTAVVAWNLLRFALWAAVEIFHFSVWAGGKVYILSCWASREIHQFAKGNKLEYDAANARRIGNNHEQP